MSPIRKRVLEVPNYVTSETLGELDNRFYAFEEKIKERFRNLEERATHLKSSNAK